MAGIDELNAFQMMKRTLESEVKQRIMDDIIDDQVKALRKRLELEIKPLLQAVTFESIDMMRDLMQMRDEFAVYITVNEDTFKAYTNQ